MKAIAFAQQFTLDDLRAFSSQSIDTLHSFIDGVTDAHVAFLPDDPNASDPYAVEGEAHIGWSLGHLIAHVTASAEEAAAFSSLLARGVPAKERPRFETPWREMVTVEHCVQRLEESRRIRLAYLDTWPDRPFLDVYREVSPRVLEKYGPLNAPASLLFGLMHETGHYDQFREVRRQALEALGEPAAR